MADEDKSAELVQNNAENSDKPLSIKEIKETIEENKKLLEQIIEERRKIERTTAEILVNGRSQAGQTVKTETADEKWAREAELRYAGTGMSPVPSKK